MTTSSTSADARNPMITTSRAFGAAELREQQRNDSSLWNPPSPANRSPQGIRPRTSRPRQGPQQHRQATGRRLQLRVAPSRHRGSGPARSARATIRICVAEVDHGSDTATATASPSAIGASRVRLRLAARLGATASTILGGLCSCSGHAPTARCHLPSAVIRRHAGTMPHLAALDSVRKLRARLARALRIERLPASFGDGPSKAIAPASAARRHQPSYPAHAVAADRVAASARARFISSKRKSATGMSGSASSACWRRPPQPVYPATKSSK